MGSALTRWHDADLVRAQAHAAPHFNHISTNLPGTPPPDVALAMTQNFFATPDTSRLSTPAGTAETLEAGGRYSQARHEVGTSRQREAAHRRRRTAAQHFCPFRGCGSSFTRKHNLKSASSSWGSRSKFAEYGHRRSYPMPRESKIVPLCRLSADLQQPKRARRTL